MTHSVRDGAHQREVAFLKTLEDLVRLESPTEHKPSADTLADYLETQLRADNWEVERVPQSSVGDQIIARMVAANDGPKTLLLTHYDTVWPLGTLAEMPFRRDGNQVYGPGVLDMKAGIAVAMHAPALAKALGRPLEGSLTLLITSDEETGSAYSRELIETLAQEHDRVLVLEPGRDDGALKVGRKGVGNFYATFTGQSAHAGNNPDDGSSALCELAHYLLFAESLNDKDAETTVNVTVARGGTVSNVIAEKATATVDMRVMQQSEAERVEAALRGYEPKDSRVSVEITGGLNRPPLELTDANRALFEKARAAMDDLGFELEGAVVGGGSDGSFTSALGVATLDGLGSSGKGPHARHEHIRVAETLDRLALVTALITDAPASS